MASPVLAIVVLAVATTTLWAQTPDQSVTANLVIQVQELQDEVRMLRGQLEEQQRELESLKKRQRDQYLDLDQRITERQNGGAQPAAEGVEPGAAQEPAEPETQPEGPVAGATTGAVAEDVPEVRAPMEAPSETVALDEPAAQNQAVTPATEDEKAAYDKAFQALKELRYADAAEEFETFTSQYPNSEYADNAQYWLGESYYVTRNYDLALTSFQKLMDRYPDSPKVPDALLKVGYTHYEMKAWDRARAALLQVQSSYPDTTLARLAASRLRSMQMEGHY